MSTQNIDKSLEKYGEKFKIQSSILVDCQNEKELKSCFACEYLLNCEIRKTYVKTVYESMSHGEVGEFEF